MDRPAPSTTSIASFPASSTARATVTGLVVIQRGDDGQRQLDEDEAVTILLENCEDAYGFPPYSQIESFLHSGNGTNLALVEQTTIRAALSGVPATLLSSSTRDWWLHLPGLSTRNCSSAQSREAAQTPPRSRRELMGALRGDGRLTASSEPALSPDD